MKNHTLYLRSNGVHIDFIIPIVEITPTLLQGLEYGTDDQYLAFGWGDRQFYLETPKWKDLTLGNGLSGMLLATPSLMHVSRMHKLSDKWVHVNLSGDQNDKLQAYIESSFELDSANRKVMLTNAGYYQNDAFYEANGSFTCLRTCNSWANQGLKQSGMKACAWTPFSFGVLRLYR